MKNSYKRLLAYLGIFAGSGGLLILMLSIWSSAPSMEMKVATGAIAAVTAAAAYAMINDIKEWK